MKIEFTAVKLLKDCKSFPELQNNWDHLIYYADGCKKDVTEMYTQTITDAPEWKDVLELYEFDGWFIVLWTN